MMTLQAAVPRFGSDWKSLSLGKDERKPLTRSELFTIEYDAFSRGKKQGFEEGRENGQSIGLKKGFEKGYQAGLEKGGEYGYQKGYAAGRAEG